MLFRYRRHRNVNDVYTISWQHRLHRDVLSCLHRRHRDVDDVYTISCQHRLHWCTILFTSSTSSTSRCERCIHDIVSTAFTSIYYHVDIVDIVDIAMWKIYTQYCVNIVHIDVLSCLYRRYRRHRDSWNEWEFWLILLVRSWSRRASLSVLQSVNIYHLRGVTTKTLVYASNFAQSGEFCVRVLVTLLYIRTSFRADFWLRRTTSWIFIVIKANIMKNFRWFNKAIVYFYFAMSTM